MSPVGHQAIAWTNIDLSSIPTEAAFNEIFWQRCIFVQGNVFEIGICKMVAIFLWRNLASQGHNVYHKACFDYVAIVL